REESDPDRNSLIDQNDTLPIRSIQETPIRFISQSVTQSVSPCNYRLYEAREIKLGTGSGRAEHTEIPS
ncbi:MAG TPA: hypothetical protein PKX37_10525, partial [Flexilinea sp.]|nr:hypothetical protein [Flexilinea sp.]